MITVVPTHHKRFFRLKSYFEPYSKFQLRLAPTESEPFEIQIATRIKVTVSPLFLENDSPEWIEAALLRYAQDYVKGYCPETKLVELSEESRGIEKKLRDIHQTLLEDFEKASEGEEQSLREIWLRLREDYFPDRSDIDDYNVVWSGRRQTMSLATCSIHRRKVAVAKAMSLGEGAPYLEPLLYHEMCHAILGEPEVVDGRRIMHGRDFKELEKRHPDISKLDLWIKQGGWNRVVKMAEG